MSKKGKKAFHAKKEKFNRPWQEESPVKAKKHLGQHFLKDETVAQKIGETLKLDGYRNVLEIGPGTGVLTKYLLEKDIDLVAMDLDEESIIYLNHSFPLEHNKLMQRKGEFKVLEADFLQCDLWTLFGEEQFAITGNFPYNISTQIVFKMLEFKDQIPEFTGMFQKEVAERICERKGARPMEFYPFWYRHFTKLNIYLRFRHKYLIRLPRCSQEYCDLQERKISIWTWMKDCSNRWSRRRLTSAERPFVTV